MSKSVWVRSVFSLFHCSPNRLYLRLALAREKEGARRGHLSRISSLCSILLNCKARKICIAKIWISGEDTKLCKLILSSWAEFTRRVVGCVGVSVGRVFITTEFRQRNLHTRVGTTSWRAVNLARWLAMWARTEFLWSHQTWSNPIPGTYFTIDGVLA